ncbi:tyrosine-type recombinase/integrase [Cetobacterium sp.]|uniref:tyrosine-type recombinase/integrase n=1 Tax=Cetobacterium sp. TaxID=2071632 RepID=UPI003F2E8633
MGRADHLNDRQINLFEKELYKELKYWCIWKVGYHLMLRISDTLKITKEEAEKYIRTGKYSSYDQKTGKENIKPLSPEALTTFKTALELAGDSLYLFPSPVNKNKPISRVAVFQKYKYTSEWLGFKETVSTHTARKTSATKIYNMTKNVVLVSRLLKHSNIGVTMTYLGISSHEEEEALLML